MNTLGIEAIPCDMGEAIEELKKDTFIQKVLGDHVFQKYVKAKEQEWNDYRAQVTDWEIEEYLYKI